MHTPPQTWQNFARYIRMPEPEARDWWTALCRARWSEAVTLRQSFLLHAVVSLDTKGLAHHTASPAALARILGNLQREAILTHHRANTLLEYVLQCTDAEGHWIQRH